MSHRASLWSIDPASEPRRAIEVAEAKSQLPLVWICGLNAADLPATDKVTSIALDFAEVVARLRVRANFLDGTLGAGGVIAGYAQLLSDAIAAAAHQRIEIEFGDLAALDITLHHRLAVVVRGIEEQDANVSFELPPVKQINPFTQEEMQTPPRRLQGLRAVLLSIADFDRAARLPTVHRYLTGEALTDRVQLNIELLIGAPVGVNTPWRQVVERRSRRR
jgi:hypothetical protein